MSSGKNNLVPEKYSAGGIVINPDGEIVLVLQLDHTWTFPKGTIRTGESNKGTARREIEEETGIRDLTLKKHLGYIRRWSKYDDRDYWKQIDMFLFFSKSSDLEPVDPDIEKAEWFSMAKAVSVLTRKEDSDFLKEKLKEL